MLSRTRRFAPTIILLTSFLLSTLTARAQGTTAEWTRLNSVPAGSKLAVKLKNGKTANGKLISVSDATLALTVKNASTEFKREDILSVHQIIKKSAAKSTLIGLAVGGGTGTLIGVAADASNNDDGFEKIDNVAAGAVAVIGAVAGAVTGFLVGKSGNKKLLIYESK